jgi:hypothetical protein
MPSMTIDPANKSSSPITGSVWIWTLLAVAVAIRLFALLLAWGTAPSGDPSNYLQLTQSLLAGEGLSLPRLGSTVPVPTSMYPPALPLLLAAIGLVVPLNALTLCIANTLIDCIAALLLARLARLLDAPGAAIPAALVYLLWPSIALMSPLAYKEGLIVALLLGTVVTLLEQAKRPGLHWALLSGVCGGALLLTQPGLLTLLPIIFIVLARQFGSWRRWWAVSLTAACATLVVVTPWWIRNALVFGQFVPLTSSGGLALWVGAQPGGGVVWRAPPKSWWSLGEMEAARLAAAEAWRIILADPLGYVARCLTKFPRSFFYSNWAIDQLIMAKGQRWPGLIQSSLLRFGPTLVELWAVAMAGIGLYRLRLQPTAWLLWACIAQVMLFGIWFEFSERHRLFLTPFLLLVAAQLLVFSRREAPREAIMS